MDKPTPSHVHESDTSAKPVEAGAENVQDEPVMFQIRRKEPGAQWFTPSETGYRLAGEHPEVWERRELVVRSAAPAAAALPMPAPERPTAEQARQALEFLYAHP